VLEMVSEACVMLEKVPDDVLNEKYVLDCKDSAYVLIELADGTPL